MTGLSSCPALITMIIKPEQVVLLNICEQIMVHCLCARGISVEHRKLQFLNSAVFDNFYSLCRLLF
jgi:hypothetical protein